MTNHEAAAPGQKPLSTVRRKAIGSTPLSLVRLSSLPADANLPLLIEPALRGVDLIRWAAGNKEFIETRLLTHGALLFRNFNVDGAAEFEQFITAVSGAPLEYRERSSPRSQVSGNIYTSTDHPANQSIFLHNENSYQQTWPLKIFFFCDTPARDGGQTPIADVRKVYQRLDPKIRECFASKHWMYIRNFGNGLGLPWQAVFQTTDKTVVEEHCRRHEIEVAWKDGDRLRTRAIRPAIARHPRSGELLWFNHATFFHVTTLEPALRAALLREFDEDDLPTNTCYGDGTQIEPETLDQLRAAYKQETVVFKWQQGDILLLDNMLAAHGRAPYAGSRKILVGMAEPCCERGT